VSDSVQWVLVLLLAATAARAQPPVPREPRQRSITLTGDPADPFPVVHVARGVRTVLLFDSPVKGGESELDPTRLRLVEAGRWVIILEPLGEPAPGESWSLRVAWEDEQAPGGAGFTLVSHPDEVDTVLTVTRRARLPAPAPVCQERLTRLEARCGARSALGFAQGGLLNEEGISTVALKPAQPGPRGELSSNQGLVHRGKGWALVVVRIANDRRPTFRDRPCRGPGASLTSVASALWNPLQA
jgi:uncharacterized protein (TIGR02268 family)